MKLRPATQSDIASIKLHEEFGFHESARMEEVAVKGGKLLTLVLMQKVLK